MVVTGEKKEARGEASKQSESSLLARFQVVLVANGPPLDYSFKELRSCGELETEEPRSGQKLPESSAEPREGSPSRARQPKVVIRKVTTSVKLNNNMLDTMAGLPQALEPGARSF